jgi:hypothetical protein
MKYLPGKQSLHFHQVVRWLRPAPKRSMVILAANMATLVPAARSLK